jgi:hypothetical protein
MLFIFADVAFCQLQRVASLLVGALDDFVVYVRVIHHVADLEAAILKVPADDIKYQG